MDVEKRIKELEEMERIEKEKLAEETKSALVGEQVEETLLVNSSSLRENNSPLANLSKMQNEYFNNQFENGKSLQEVTMDMAKASITGSILSDDSDEGINYRKELKDEQKATIKESFKQDRLKEQTDTMSAKKQKAEAFYTSVRPILEFDFDNLIRKKEKDDKGAKTYKDRSYGIPLMILMLVLLVVPYCVISIVLAIFNGINAILETISTFGKIARVLALSIFVIVMVVLVIYCAILGIESIFNVAIIPR